jgi:hypothetical protein
MGRADPVMCAVDAPLQDGEVALHGVRVDGSAHVLALAVAYGFMAGEIAIKALVAPSLIGDDRCVLLDVLSDRSLEIDGINAGDVEAPSTAVALHKR